MKNKNMPLLAMGILLLASCSKTNNNAPTGNPEVRPDWHSMADEDHNIPIFNHKVTTADGQGMPGATDSLYNGHDTLFGITDNNGNCTFYPPYLGTWNISVYHDGYLPFHKQIQLIDSVSSETAILEQ